MGQHNIEQSKRTSILLSEAMACSMVTNGMAAAMLGCGRNPWKFLWSRQGEGGCALVRSLSRSRVRAKPLRAK